MRLLQTGGVRKPHTHTHIAPRARGHLSSTRKTKRGCSRARWGRGRTARACTHTRVLFLAPYNIGRADGVLLTGTNESRRPREQRVRASLAMAHHAMGSTSSLLCPSRLRYEAKACGCAQNNTRVMRLCGHSPTPEAAPENMCSLLATLPHFRAPPAVLGAGLVMGPYGG